MATLELSYSELMNSSVTGVQAVIYDDGDRVFARFSNFDPEVGESYRNQSETFVIPTVEAGLLMMQSNKGYHQVPLTEEDKVHNANTPCNSVPSDLETISIHSSMGLISARLEKEESYPGIFILVDGNLAAAIECCEEEGRLMIRSYSRTHDAPLSVNVETAQVYIPKDWPAEVVPRG